jgi:diguanylate cyclase (GGDEF)-like protein
MIRRQVWLEVGVLCLLFYGVERLLFPGRPAFFGATPHPYWIGVLLFALRYGLGAGLLSGSSLSALYLYGVWTHGDRFRFEDPEFYLLPGLFMLAGAVLGGAIDRQERMRAGAKRRVSNLEKENESLTEELEAQRRITHAVEQQVVTRMSSLVTLYQGARELGNLDRNALYRGILEFFSQALQADKIAIYFKEGGEWTLRHKKGWQDSDAYPETVRYTEGVIGKAGAEGAVVSLRDFFAADAEKAWLNRDKSDAIMAGPLRKDDGEVIGVLAVQNMDLLRFNSASINLLSLLLDWASESITKSLYFDELRSKLILDEVLDVYNERYFKDRGGQEFARSKTYLLPFSMLLISVENFRALPLERRLRALRAISELLRRTARDIDIVTKFPDPDTPFAVLMMTASENQAKEQRDAIARAFERIGLGDADDDGASLRLKIGIGSFAPEMESMEDLVAAARDSL